MKKIITQSFWTPQGTVHVAGELGISPIISLTQGLNSAELHSAAACALNFLNCGFSEIKMSLAAWSLHNQQGVRDLEKILNEEFKADVLISVQSNICLISKKPEDKKVD